MESIKTRDSLKPWVHVRCPSESCASVFDAPERRLGRNMYCPDCGIRLTVKPLDLEQQLERREVQEQSGTGASIQRLPLAVLVDNVRSLWNVGSIFRTADACGVQRVLLSGITGCPPRPEIHKTALGAEQAVEWSYRADPRVALEDLLRDGFQPVAIETSPQATPLDRFCWPADRIGLVIGNEVSGVSPEVLQACEHHVSIPMLGIKQSLNVAVAFGIAVFQARRHLTCRAEAAGESR